MTLLRCSLSMALTPNDLLLAFTLHKPIQLVTTHEGSRTAPMSPAKKQKGGEFGEWQIPKEAPSEPKTRRSSTDLRKEHTGVGALLLRIIWSAIEWAVPGAARVPDAEKTRVFNKADGRDSKQREMQYRTCERKGFRVVKDTGCFAPHAQYATKGKGASEKGYQLAFFARHGFVPKQHGKGDPNVDAATGRDLSWQLSHLCHCRWCCRLDHLCIEQRWRNLMRNFCLGPVKGFRLANGTKIDTCGCSLQFHVCGKSDQAGPPCVAAYTVSPEAPPADLNACKTTGEVDDVLSRTGFPLKYEHVAYADRDKVSELRNHRKSAKALRKEAVALSPPAKNMAKKADFAIAFGDSNVNDPTRTLVVLSESDSDFE